MRKLEGMWTGNPGKGPSLQRSPRSQCSLLRTRPTYTNGQWGKRYRAKALQHGMPSLLPYHVRLHCSVHSASWTRSSITRYKWFCPQVSPFPASQWESGGNWQRRTQRDLQRCCLVRQVHGIGIPLETEISCLPPQNNSSTGSCSANFCLDLRGPQ